MSSGSASNECKVGPSASGQDNIFNNYLRDMHDMRGSNIKLPPGGVPASAMPDPGFYNPPSNQHEGLDEVAVEGLSDDRDDYIPVRLARDPPKERPATIEGQKDAINNKKGYKKPREVNLVAEYVRNFIKSSLYHSDKSLNEQGEATKLLLKKLTAKFPKGDWNLQIVQALLREKTRKKRRSSIVPAEAATTTNTVAATVASNKRARISTGMSKERLPNWAIDVMRRIAMNTAAINNVRVRRRNTSRLQAMQGDVTLVALVKEREGVHSLAGIMPADVDIPPKGGDFVEEVVHIGSCPRIAGELVRGGVDAIKAMTQMQILQLIRVYNDDMSIIPADDLPTRTRKVLAWFCE